VAQFSHGSASIMRLRVARKARSVFRGKIDHVADSWISLRCIEATADVRMAVAE